MISGSVEPMQIDDEHADNAANAGEPTEQLMVNGDNAISSDFKVQYCSIDLDAYATQYQELFRVNRLIFIAEHCPSVRKDALVLALQSIESTNNVDMYKKVHSMLSESGSAQNAHDINGSSDRTIPSMDKQWIETASRNASTRFEKLDSDLRSYKSNSIKESIRRGHSDMGKHFLNTG